MNKTIVFYKSKFGTSKDYARLISDTLNCELYDYDDVSLDKLLEYDTIIFGGGLYRNGINGASIITKNYEKLKNKQIIVFTVGLSSSNDPDFFFPCLNQLFTKEMQEKIMFFHFPLGINNPSLKEINNLILKLFKNIINPETSQKLTTGEKSFLIKHGHKIDFTNEHTLYKLTKEFT